jgi:hypothetical protein
MRLHSARQAAGHCRRYRRLLKISSRIRNYATRRNLILCAGRPPPLFPVLPAQTCRPSALPVPRPALRSKHCFVLHAAVAGRPVPHVGRSGLSLPGARSASSFWVDSSHQNRNLEHATWRGVRRHFRQHLRGDARQPGGSALGPHCTELITRPSAPRSADAPRAAIVGRSLVSAG